MSDRPSDEAVRAATGRGWDEWFGLLDEAGGTAASHRELVARLVEHGVGPWWQQSVAVAYEKERGLRVLGQTSDGAFQAGVRRTLPAAPERVWALLVEQPESWLGAPLEVRRGSRWEGEGVCGEVRVVVPGQRLRLTWHPDGWPRPARLQLTVLPASGGRAVLGVHVEGLPDAAAREDALVRWRQVLDRVAAAL